MEGVRGVAAVGTGSVNGPMISMNSVTELG